MSTIADGIAALLNNDGQQFETDDGRSLGDLCEAHGASVEHAIRIHGDQGFRWEAGAPNQHFAGDPIRYVLPDGSAVVEHGDGWDLEGEAPFSWAGS